MDVNRFMTRKVVAVPPDMPVVEIAKLLIERRLSAVPVIDGLRHVVGIVSEGDLMRRPETDTQAHRRWWLSVFAAPETHAQRFVKSHGLAAKDVMTTQVVTIAPDASLADAADLMERSRVKRLPVTREDRLIGIISRADLVRAFVAARPTLPTDDSDAAIRERLEDVLQRERWVPFEDIYVTVLERTAHLWGTVRSEAQSEATELLARGLPGVRDVKNHLTIDSGPIRGPLLSP
jgi:CBS domain-containing protein